MTSPEPITLKFKMADAEQLDAAMVEVLESDFNLNDSLRNQAAEIVRSVHLALVRTGCVIIQIDNDDTGLRRRRDCEYLSEACTCGHAKGQHGGHYGNYRGSEACGYCTCPHFISST